MLATALLFGIIILVYLAVSWWPNAITEDPIEMPKKAIEWYYKINSFKIIFYVFAKTMSIW